ncbi:MULTISPECIES: hypothetical protein [unclassified Cyanobium]|uniref:hypothetical protein n=1 Tax=unclassified Cyanobium TaxID=2627006 RepID=UPI0020CDE9C1|nr:MULTISPECIES: hypothetical protein [unclassified Cyanobium]MCP9777827.1 hypothetical protein [Cyanobium sp. Tous-M-B4]MCP9876733.1 hypothetical protein [Cyanobium sp. A2C-AMD]
MQQDPSSLNSLQALESAVASWRGLGARYGGQLADSDWLLHGSDEQRARAIDLLLELGEVQRARLAVLQWLLQWRDGLPLHLPDPPDPDQLAAPQLWACLADVSERCSDPQLPELFWQTLDQLKPAPPPQGCLPLLGVPLLNGVEHLLALLASLDLPVQTLAIVDQSGDRNDEEAVALRRVLVRLEEEGHPRVGRVRVARPFGNLGVAGAWNLILRSFPEASLALIANHDVRLAPGVLAMALERMDTDRPQFMPLLPGERAFSAFLLTALAWDAVGLFDERFYPAYCEDLDYRDRLLACPAVDRLDGSFAHAPMLACNPQESATLRRDPTLAAQNRRSFPLNRLWYLHRGRGSGRALLRSGEWRHRWFGRWT